MGSEGNLHDDKEMAEAVKLAKDLTDSDVPLGIKNSIVEAHHSYYIKYPFFKAAADSCGLTLFQQA